MASVPQLRRIRPALALGLIGVVGIAVAAAQPRSTGHDGAPTPAPYFSSGDSFIGRGTAENLDEVANADAPAASVLTPPASTWTVASAASVNLSWTRQPLADRYEVSYRNESSGQEKTVEVDAPLYTVAAAPGTTYSVAVTTIGRDGTRSESSARTAVTPTQVRSSQTVEKSGFQVAAWMPSDFDVADARDSFDRTIGVSTEVNPFWYNFAASGVLEAKGGARNPELVARAHQADQVVIPAITNNFDPDRVTALLANPAQQATLREAIVKEVEEGGFDGIDLDFENMHASDRDGYTAFVTALANDLHARGKIIEVTSQPKKSDGDTWDGPGAIDLDALRDVVDRFKVMTYDFSRPDTQPGPVAPIPWTLEVLEYWKTKVPAEKILAGLPFYGYNWSLDTDDDHGITWESAQRARDKFAVEDSIDQVAGEPYFTYSDEHGPRIAYYQDAASVSRKVEAIKSTGVAGVAIWLLGQEDPANFGAIRKQTTTVTRTVDRPLNVGVKLQGDDVQVSVTRSSDVAAVEVRYGSSPDDLTRTARAEQGSLVPLPRLGPKETRYFVAVAFGADGKELRRSGTSFVAAAGAR